MNQPIVIKGPRQGKSGTPRPDLILPQDEEDLAVLGGNTWAL